MTSLHESLELSIHNAESSAYSRLGIAEAGRPDWILSFVLQGHVETTTQQVTSVAHAGDVMVHPPHLRFSENASRPGTHLWLAFNLTLGPHLDVLRLNPVSPVVTLANPDRYAASFAELRTVWSHSASPARDLCVFGRMLDLISQVVESWEQGGKPPRPAAFQTAPDRFLGVIVYMQEHLQRKLTRDDLAGQACLHPGYFDRAFRASFGRSPMQMLRLLRLRRAQEMLAATEATLDAVADACGFADGAHLSRIFRADVGMAPGQYRESAKQTKQSYMPPLAVAAAMIYDRSSTSDQGENCMALTEEQLQHFYRDGYVVVRGLIPRSEIDAVLAAAAPQKSEGGGWQAEIYEHAHPETQYPLHRLLVEPTLVDAVRSVFGNEPRILYGMVAIVPAHGGQGLPWHQDNQYTQVLGGALNAFIALGDITPDKALLWVAPQSHRLGTQPSKATELASVAGHREAVVEPENGIQLPTMTAGDVCLFDRNTYHRSLTNDTDEPRFAYAAQYQSDNARDAETGQRESDYLPNRLRAKDLRVLWQDQIAA